MDRQHDELVVLKEAWKLSITHLSSALTKHRVYEGHDGCFQVDLIPVSSCTPVQIIYKSLWDDRSLQVLDINNFICPLKM